MTPEALKIHDLFCLSNGVTVIACQKPKGPIDWTDRKVTIQPSDHGSAIELSVSGEAALRAQSQNSEQIALETHEDISLTSEDVKQNHWCLIPGPPRPRDERGR